MVLKVQGRDANAPVEMKDDANAVEHVEQPAEETGAAETVATSQVVDDAPPQGDDAQAEVVETATTTAEAVVEEEQHQQAQASDAGTGQVVDEAEHAQAEAAERSTESVTQAVAVRSENTAVAVAGTGATENFFKNMIEGLIGDGQEGLEMGYGVFPVISLDKGEFKVGDEDIGDDEFEGVPLMSKPKFAYRQTGVPEKEADVVFADSDRAHLDAGGPVAERLAEWKVKAPESSYEIKKYQDVFLYVTRCPGKDVLEGQLVQLSVAPTSVKLYTRACLTAKSKGRAPHETVFKIGVGEKVRGEFDYYPWAFECIGSCKKLGVEVKFGSEVDENF